jgi:CubicO group peptidase (beta-lactamase class C family)
MQRRARHLCLVCCLSLRAQTPAPQLDPVIEKALADAGAPSVSIAVVQNTAISYVKAFGKADTSTTRSADANTRYAVGSISKQFTAAAILLLQEQGKLSLDDKVSKYFPALTRANEITVRQLLSHTSGYEDFAPQDYLIPEWTKPTTPMAILNQWARKPLNFDPGTRWQYSNTGYVLAGQIFEKASGQKLVPFLRARIFGPLGMSSAGDCEIASPADALAYTRFALGPPRRVGREATGWYSGAGELCMTPSDVARWDVAFLQKRILSARSYDEFTREVRLKDGNVTHYALGVSVNDLKGIPQFSHGGEVSGFLAENRVFPTRGVAVVACSNEDGVHLVDGLSEKIALLLMQPAQAEAPPAEITQVRGILEGLQAGRIDRSRFTSNANSYFSDQALQDYRTSLAALGKLQSVSRENEQLRGGMTHRSYKAAFEKKSVSLNVYLLPDGKFEQFMVMQGE